MKFIKQNEDSINIINLECCKNFFTMKLSHQQDPFIIRFVFAVPYSDSDDYESWNYTNKSERDQQFKNICELVEVQRIGN